MKKLFVILVVTIAFLRLVTIVQAQEVVSAQVDRVNLSTDETVTLSVTVNANATEAGMDFWTANASGAACMKGSATW